MCDNSRAFNSGRMKFFNMKAKKYLNLFEKEINY